MRRTKVKYNLKDTGINRQKLKYNTFRANLNRTGINFRNPNKISAFGRFEFTTLLNPPSEGGDRIETSNRDSTLKTHAHTEKEKSRDSVSLSASIEGPKEKSELLP